MQHHPPDVDPHNDAERPIPEGMIETDAGLIIFPRREGVRCVLTGRRMGYEKVKIDSSLED